MLFLLCDNHSFCQPYPDLDTDLNNNCREEKGNAAGQVQLDKVCSEKSSLDSAFCGHIP